MVSFSCESCGDVLTKKKLDPHRNRCRGATFTCIDCMVHFPGVQYRQHTSCMTEDQKYQGALYKDKNNKKQKHSHPSPAAPQPAHQYQAEPEPKSKSKTTKTKTKTKANPSDPTMAHHAYVEDYADHEYDWSEYEDDSDHDSPSGPLPEAPTPPPAAPEPHVDVFEFLVASGQTPNASNANLPGDQDLPDMENSTSLVRYEAKEPASEEYYSLMEDEVINVNERYDVEYGTAPVRSGEFVTPAPKRSERRKSKEGSEKKDKKRKRLHVDIPGDQVMTDAPPVLHSGLTGGLNRMMRPVFPPSPDYSGGDVPEVSPASPLKKSKSGKHSKHTKGSSSLFGIIAGSSKTKASKSKSKSSSKSSKTTKKSSSSSRKDPKEKKTQLIEYRPQSKDGKSDAEGQVILYKPRADVFLSFVDKGPESDKGCSMNKMLKRFHREREATGSELGKSKEEKELWRSLRLRQNERGEIVLFSV